MATLRDAISLVRNARAFMELRADEAPPLRSTIVGYVAVLALVPLVFTSIGDALFAGVTSSDYASYAETLALSYTLGIMITIVVGLIVWRLAPRFASEGNLNRAMMLVSYGATPAFLFAVLDIAGVPSGGLAEVLVLLLGFIYGLYIFSVGLPILLKTPATRVRAYVGITAVSVIVVFIILEFAEILIIDGPGAL